MTLVKMPKIAGTSILFPVVSSGSPSRIRIVRRISFGMTILPRSSIRLTIPVAFIIYNNLLALQICTVSISKTRRFILDFYICQSEYIGQIKGVCINEMVFAIIVSNNKTIFIKDSVNLHPTILNLSSFILSLIPILYILYS